MLTLKGDVQIQLRVFQSFVQFVHFCVSSDLLPGFPQISQGSYCQAGPRPLWMSSRERLVVAFANGAVLGGGLLLVESQCYQTIEEDEMKQVSSITFLKGVISPSHSKIIFRVLSGKSSKTTKNSIFWCIYGCALHVPGPPEGEKFPVIALDYQHRRSASALFL